jgi:gamma-glutamylcyclotransferase (GGCT)/AIG2-like uncharacterized protein YtfP
MSAFFFYGTLIDPDVRRAVLGTVGHGQPEFAATLPGFAVRYALRARYPVLAAVPGARAKGVVLNGLLKEQAKSLDRFEGHGYRREIRIVSTDDGQRLPASVYIPTTTLRAARRPWSYETWCRQDKRHFLHLSGLNNPLRALGTDSRARS